MNIQVDCFAEELERKTDESARRKEEIRAHLAKMADLQKRVRNVSAACKKTTCDLMGLELYSVY